MKSPMSRSSKLNSSIKSDVRGKVNTTRTPRKGGFGLKSTLAFQKEPEPQPEEQEVAFLDVEDEVEDISMPDDRP